MKEIKLYYWSDPSTEKHNFGDLLSKYIVEKTSNKKVRLINPSSRWYKKILKHYFAIGSILCRANKNSIVWGSGIIKKDEKVKPAKFVAVRGPETRKRLVELGYNVPKVFGDPGLLTPLFYMPKNIKKRYKLGIVPHYVDYQEIKKNYENNSEVLIIDLMCHKVEDVINKVTQCEKIISSSLHGVIIAHSYNIPAIWLKCGDKLSGDDIKFYDYYKSLNINYPTPKYFNYKTKDVDTLFKEYTNVSLPNLININNLQKGLIESCPFISKISKKKLLSDENWK